MLFRKHIEYSEFLLAVGRIKGRHSTTDFFFFCSVDRSIISGLGTHILTSQRNVRRLVNGLPWVTTYVEDEYIAVMVNRNQRSTCLRVKSMVIATIGKTIICHYCARNVTHERFVHPDTSSLCSFIPAIPRNMLRGVDNVPNRLCLTGTTSRKNHDLPWMISVEVSKESTDLYIFKQGTVTTIRYRDEFLYSTVELYAAKVGLPFKGWKYGSP